MLRSTASMGGCSYGVDGRKGAATKSKRSIPQAACVRRVGGAFIPSWLVASLSSFQIFQIVEEKSRALALEIRKTRDTNKTSE